MGRTSQPSIETNSGVAEAADIVAGEQAFTVTTAATTVITVPAGRTWAGVISVNCAVTVAAASATAGSAVGVVSVAGAGASPAAGNYLTCTALAAANAATGLTGDSGDNTVTQSAVVVAPVGNAVTVQATATITGTAGAVNVTAWGSLQ